MDQLRSERGVRSLEAIVPVPAEPLFIDDVVVDVLGPLMLPEVLPVVPAVLPVPMLLLEVVLLGLVAPPAVPLVVVEGVVAAGPPRVPALPALVPELFVEPALPLVEPDVPLLDAPVLPPPVEPPVDPVCAYERPIALATNIVASAEARDFFILILLN